MTKHGDQFDHFDIEKKEEKPTEKNKVGREGRPRTGTQNLNKQLGTATRPDPSEVVGSDSLPGTVREIGNQIELDDRIR